MQKIIKYFPLLSSDQIHQFTALDSLYKDWNQKVNVISRKDIDNLYLHHVLHSLTIARFIQFSSGSKILDAGTGGGFPGIPLAIMFPQSEFILADSIGKKIKVVNAVAKEIGLSNVRGVWERAEDVDGEFDFIVSRAVTRLDTFHSWVEDKVVEEERNSIKNGILYLKGGDISSEIASISNKISIHPLTNLIPEPFFAEKHLIHISI